MGIHNRAHWGDYKQGPKRKRKHDSKALKALRTMLFWVGAVLVVLGVIASSLLFAAPDADFVQTIYSPLLDLSAFSDVREDEIAEELTKYTVGAALLGALLIILSGKVLPSSR